MLLRQPRFARPQPNGDSVVGGVVPGRRSRPCALASVGQTSSRWCELGVGSWQRRSRAASGPGGRFADDVRPADHQGLSESVVQAGALRAFLWSLGVPMSGYAAYVKRATEELVAHAEGMASEAGRPFLYVYGPAASKAGQPKDDLARQIAERDGITEGVGVRAASGGAVHHLRVAPPLRRRGSRGAQIVHTG